MVEISAYMACDTILFTPSIWLRLTYLIFRLKFKGPDYDVKG